MSRLVPSLLVVAAVAACGGKSSSSTTPGSTAGSDRLPWEAALTMGASFTLQEEVGEGGDPVVVKVASVSDHGNERVYGLEWSSGQGPARIVVRDGVVLLGDAKPEDMKAPFAGPGETCYGEDFSNPDGCDDVCDANLCLTGAGIVSVDGLYAPNYGAYTAK